MAWGRACFHTPVPSPLGSLPSIDPYGKAVTAMRRPATLVLGGLAAVAVIARGSEAARLKDGKRAADAERHRLARELGLRADDEGRRR